MPSPQRRQTTSVHRCVGQTIDGRCIDCLKAERDLLREEAHRFRQLATRAWTHMQHIRAERWLADFDQAEAVAQKLDEAAAMKALRNV